MLGRKIKSGSSALVLALIVFLIVLAINFLSARNFKRVDLTENRVYTISDSTKKSLRNLDDIVRLEAYFSKKPPRVAQIRGEVEDMLNEYGIYSKGNLQIDFIDPAEDETLKQKLRFMGIPELQVNVREKDKLEVANVFMGLAVLYGDKKEVLPVVQSTANLEYNLTSAILKVTRTETKTVGFLTGHDELDVNSQQFQRLREELNKQYTVTSVELKAGKPVDETVTTLVIAGPQNVLTEREKYEIDQFIMRGGRTVFLVDPIKLQPAGLQATPLATGLNDLLEHYGVKLGNNLLLDGRFHDMATFQQGFMSMTQSYPYFVKAVRQNLSEESAITSQLDSVVLPWPSSLELTTKEDGQVKGAVLAKTSEAAWTAQSPYNLNPNGILRAPPASWKVYTLAIHLSGVFKSFYDGKAIPAADGDESGNANRTTTPQSEPTQIIVVGTSQFLTQGRQDGQVFFLNAVDSLTLGKDLIGIRSQSVTDRPLKETSDSEKLLLKFLVIGGIPIGVAIFGITRYFLRRRAKRLVEEYGKI